jgi:two-component system, NtrC family, response regulator HydG
MQKAYENLTLLVAAGDHEVLQRLSEVLLTVETRVITATKGHHVLNCLGKENVSVTIIDHKLADMDGLSLVGMLHDKFPEVGVIMTSPTERSELYTKAMQMGAFDVLTPPYSKERVHIILEKLLAWRRLLEQNESLRRQLDEKFGLHRIIGNSMAMQRIYNQIHQMANSRSNLLLLGEPGTGKELVARVIHRLSRRGEKPFVSVNCGPVPEDVVEGEIFGREQNAHPVYAAAFEGKLALAEGGTLYLEEVERLSAMAQQKLLRFLDEQTYERQGGIRSLSADVRIIAAGGGDMDALAEKEAFQRDLYSRLKVATMKLPPLRERQEDLALLVQHFLNEFAQKNETTAPRLSNEAFQAIYTYQWPGNIRELRNHLEGLVVRVNGGVIEFEDLPESIRNAAGPANGIRFRVGEPLVTVERELILATLANVDGNRRQASRLLGIGLRTLFRKINKYRNEGFEVP